MSEIEIRFPGMLAQKEMTLRMPGTFVLGGTITLSKEGISHRGEGHLMNWFYKINLINKFIWRYYVGKPIPYNRIVEIRPWSWRNGQGLEVITNEINGSYFLALADADQSTINLMIDFLYCCRDVGFEQAMSYDADGKYDTLLGYAETARKSVIPFAVVLMVAGILTYPIPIPFVSFMLLLCSITPARQSGKKSLYLASVVLLILWFIGRGV